MTSLQALRTDKIKEKIEGGRTRHSFRDKNADVRALVTFSSKRTPNADQNADQVQVDCSQ